MAKNLNNQGDLSTDLTTPGNGTQRLSDDLIAIEAQNITISYGKTKVLENVYCHFKKHCVTAIMGPSGGGKSTLIRVLNRSLELIPEANFLGGKVLYAGENIYRENINPATIRKKNRPYPPTTNTLSTFYIGKCLVWTNLPPLDRKDGP